MYTFDTNKAVDELTKNGFTYLPSIFELTQSLNTYSSICSQLNGKTYIENSLGQNELVNAMGLEKLFDKFLKSNEENYGAKLGKDDKYFIARHVKPGQNSEAYRGHFDSHLLTIVLPIKIPEIVNGKNTERGELKAFPKTRSFRKSEILNIFQKLYWKLFASKSGFEKLEKNNKMICEYFDDYRPFAFIGVTTFHGNNIVSSENTDRLTLLCHCFDPSPKFGIGNTLRKLRNR
ncbi:MAG: hypothetical protein ACPH5I_03155 [Amylibacter sp.]